MNFPPLVRSPESHVSALYRRYQIDEVAYQYLFRGRSYNWLDQHVLYQDSEETHGFHSKGILLSLGLREQHQSVFKGFSIGKAMGILKTVSGSEQIVAILERYQAGNNNTDLGAYNLSSGGREFRAPELKKGKRVPMAVFSDTSHYGSTIPDSGGISLAIASESTIRRLRVVTRCASCVSRFFVCMLLEGRELLKTRWFD